MSFCTIREFARKGLVSEGYIRGLVRRGRCPGIRVGNRFYMNSELFTEMLERESLKAVEPEEDGRG